MDNKEDILKRLNSNDTILFNEAIEDIKSSGDMSVVPALFDLLCAGKDHQTTNAIINLLADIKENSFKELLINRIKATRAATPKSLLLRICWESALDFSDHAELFAELLLQDEFIVALEASTIIEELQHISEESRHKVVKLLKSAKTGEEKQFLIDNILSVLG